MNRTRKGKSQRLLAIFLCLAALIGVMPAGTALAWSGTAGQQTTSTFGDYLEGYDGHGYSSAKGYVTMTYHGDGTTSYEEHSGGVARRSYGMFNEAGEFRRVYCIEAGVEYIRNQSYTSQSGTENGYFNRLPETARRGIQLAALYGYAPGKSLPIAGITEDDFWLGTQFVIWEYQQQLRTDAGNRRDNGPVAADTFYNQLTGRPAELAYNWILQQIARHEKAPSFANGSTHELKYNPSTKLYSLTLTDANNSGAELEAVSGTEGVTVTRSGNAYTFTSTKMLQNPITITYRRNVPITDTCLIWGNPTYQTMMTGAGDPITFDVKIKTETFGTVKIVKASEDGQVSGISFRITGNGVDQMITTGSNGQIAQQLLPGQYTVTEQTPDKYVQPASQTVTVESGQTSTLYFSNILKKFRVEVKKQDSETGSAQGAGTLAGAVYGIYHNGELMDSYTTDAAGEFTTRYYPCGEDWTLREISPSEGYLLDETVYPVGSEPGNYTVEFNTAKNNVTEQVIKGKIRLVKHIDAPDTDLPPEEAGSGSGNEGMIEQPEEGAVFEVHLASAGSYEQAKDRERARITTDSDGFAETPLLPYGIYRVRQLSGMEGQALIPNFTVTISEQDRTYSFILNNSTITSKIRVEKRDVETDELIPAEASFQIYKPDGTLLVQHMDYPTPVDISTFTTTSDGWLMLPQPLDYGAGYRLVEVESPYGYVLSKEPVSFDVTGEQDVVTVEYHNAPQKGVIQIEKTGEVLTSVQENDGLYLPVYEARPLEGAVYDVIADEDIVVGGDIKAKKGDVVDTVTTGEKDGKSNPLYLGRYQIVERQAPEGMTIHPEPQEVELRYGGQEIELVETTAAFYNERQKVRIDFVKTLEQDKTFHLGMNGEILLVQFGLYAADDIVAADGSRIPKDGLIATASPKEDGTGTFAVDLPFGNFYAREIAVDGHYLVSDQTYPIVFAYEGQDIQTVPISLNDGQPIANDLLRGKIEGSKTDEDGQPVKGALIGLFDEDAEEFTEETAILTVISGQDGSFAFAHIPQGHFVCREITPAEGFVGSEEAHHIYNVADGQVTQVHIENRHITGTVQVRKTDADYPDALLSGAVFEIYRDENGDGVLDAGDMLMGEMQEVDAGIYEMTGLRYHRYLLVEKQSPAHFLRDEAVYPFAITTDGEIVVVENEAGRGFINRAQTGSLVITKTADDGKKEGFRFTVTGEDFMGNSFTATYETDANGKINVELRPGKYTVSEEAGEHTKSYDLPDSQEVEIKADKTAELAFYRHDEEIPATDQKRGTKGNRAAGQADIKAAIQKGRGTEQYRDYGQEHRQLFPHCQEIQGGFCPQAFQERPDKILCVFQGARSGRYHCGVYGVHG